jgi:hypothetical protein
MAGADEQSKDPDEGTIAAMATMTAVSALLAELAESKAVDATRMAGRLEGLRGFMQERYPKQQAFIDEVFGLFKNSVGGRLG